MVSRYLAECLAYYAKRSESQSLYRRDFEIDPARAMSRKISVRSVLRLKRRAVARKKGAAAKFALQQRSLVRRN